MNKKNPLFHTWLTLPIWFGLVQIGRFFSFLFTYVSGHLWVPYWFEPVPFCFINFINCFELGLVREFKSWSIYGDTSQNLILMGNRFCGTWFGSIRTREIRFSGLIPHRTRIRGVWDPAYDELKNRQFLRPSNSCLRTHDKKNGYNINKPKSIFHIQLILELY